MRQTTLLLLALITIVGFSGCDNNEKPKTGPSTSPPVTTIASPATEQTLKPTPIPVDRLRTADVSDPRGFVVIQGVLGKPVGTYVRIEGVRFDGLKSGVNTLKVEKVDGTVVERPLSLVVYDLDLKEQTKYILRGFESIKMIGSPRDPEHPDEPMPQVGFQIYRFFVATEIIAPKGEKVREHQ